MRPRVSPLSEVSPRNAITPLPAWRVLSRRPALLLVVVTALMAGLAMQECYGQIVTYHIGNSLTAQLLGPNYSTRLRALSQAEGANSIRNQQDIRANQTLTHFVNVPVPEGSTATHYGTAFANSEIDTLFLQPWYGATIRQEAAAAGELVRQLRSNPANADTRILVYATWGRHSAEQSFVDTWTVGNLMLDSPFVPSALAIELFMAEFTKEVPTAELIPAGQVFYEIGRQLRSGVEIPGLSAIENLYGDQVHPSNAGAYAAALTAYTVLYGKSPVGLGYPSQMLDSNWGYVLPEEGRLPMQQLVADVVLVPEPRAATLVVGAACTMFLARYLIRFKRPRPRLTCPP